MTKLSSTLTQDDFNDLQHAKWIYNFLKVRGWLNEPLPKPFTEQTSEEVKQVVLQSLHMSHRKFGQVGSQRHTAKHLFCQMSVLYEKSKLKPSDLAFIPKLNPRIKKLIWLYIRNLHAHESTEKNSHPYAQIDDSLILKFFHSLPQEPIYPKYTLTIYPLSDAEITTSIMDFFQLWEADAILKREHLEKFRTLIKHVHEFKSIFRWLKPKDTKQCEWAFDYLQKREILQESYPVGSKSLLFDAVVASFDYWDASYEAKKLLIKDIKAAWSTKKTRDNQPSKKPYSFIMSKKIAKMLDNLSIDSELSKSDIVEKLITKAHSDLQDNRRSGT